MIDWCNGWSPVQDEAERRSFENELSREIETNREHPLYGLDYQVVGRLLGEDDFILRLGDGHQYAHVHLTWNREDRPLWPYCEIIGDESAVNRFLREWS